MPQIQTTKIKCKSQASKTSPHYINLSHSIKNTLRLTLTRWMAPVVIPVHCNAIIHLFRPLGGTVQVRATANYASRETLFIIPVAESWPHSTCPMLLPAEGGVVLGSLNLLVSLIVFFFVILKPQFLDLATFKMIRKYLTKKLFKTIAKIYQKCFDILSITFFQPYLGNFCSKNVSFNYSVHFL